MTSTYAQRRMSANRRHAGAPKRREGRRQATRNKLIAAARELFFSKNYFELSIDEIAKAAGLSRAAFYLHYPDKEAILVDLVREESGKLDVLYRWFAAVPNPSKAKIREFIRLVVRVTRRSKAQLSLFYRAASYNPDIWRTFANNRDRHIEMIGESVPAFRKRKDGAREKQRLARARLIFYQLEQVSLYATFADRAIDLEREIECLADAILEFVNAYGE